MVFKRFEDMEVWQAGRKLVKDIYSLTRNEGFLSDRGLKDQIQRAAVSICSNLAEGYARRGNRELVKYLWIAKGSASEVQSQIYHALDLGYVSELSFNALYDDLDAIQSRIYRLIQFLSQDISRQKVNHNLQTSTLNSQLSTHNP